MSMVGPGELDQGVGAVAADGPLVAPAPAFDELFRREYRSGVGLCAVLTGDRSAGEELAQDAFVSLHRHWRRVAQYDDPAAWVRRVATNLALSSRRRMVREARALLRLRTHARVTSLDLPDDDRRYWDAVRALPVRQAQCVALRYLEDRSIDDIAGILAIAPSTVRVHLHQARKTLAERFGDEFGTVE
jgi:RNA polymerase sigma-70 factor (ECF subfamily)